MRKLTLTVVLAALLLSCGGGRQPPGQSSVVSGQSSVNRVAPSFQTATPSETTLAEALAEIEVLEAPEGVDEAVFSQLKEALAEALLAQWSTGETPVIQGNGETAGTRSPPYSGGIKLISSPPDGSSNIVNDLTVRPDGEDYLLQWHYRNVGDYNQDGIVSVMDITPLAVHFNEETNDNNEVVDGNVDGVINIMDITPLAAHFFSDLARYSIQTSPSQTGTFTEIDSAPFSVAVAEGSRRLRFSVPLPEGASGFVRVVPMDGTENPGIPSNVVAVTVPPPPNPPANVEASDGLYPDKVEVTWDAPSGGPTPEGYHIYRAESEDGTYALIGDSPASPYDDESIPLGDYSHYWYKVSAFNASGESELAGPDEGWNAPPPPNAPSNVEATDGAYAGKIQVSWDAPAEGPSPDGYRVYRADSEGGTYTEIDTSAASPYDDTTVPDFATYWYKVSAYNVSGESELAGPDSGYRAAGPQPPDPPTNLDATDGVFPDKIQLTWDPPGAGPVPDGHNIYRSDSEDGTYIQIDTCSTSPYDDMSVPDYETYWYKVTAYNVDGESEPAGPVSGYRRLDPPNPPENVEASDGTFGDRIQITWQSLGPGPPTDGFNIYRSDTETGTYALIGSSPTSPYDDTTVPDFATYWYKVSAYNAAGESEQAGPNSGYKGGGPQPPNPPENVEASKGSPVDRVQVTWDPPTGGGEPDSYHIYRSLLRDEGYSEVGSVSASETQYEDFPPDFKLYWYQVTAKNAQGESDPGGPDFGYKRSGGGPPPPPVKPNPPSNVQASDGTYTDRIEITWDPPGDTFGLDGYMIWRSTEETGYYSYIGFTDGATSYDDYVSDYRMYWYKVCSYGGGGTSDKAGPDSGWRSWTITTVDSDGDVGDTPSLAYDCFGDAGIAYYDWSHGALKYAHWNGSDWDIETVDNTAEWVGSEPSLAYDADNGYPIIAYFDSSNEDLKCAWWNGTDWDLEIVDGDGGADVGQDASIALDENQYPAISYLDTDNFALKFARWTDPDWEIETVDDADPERFGWTNDLEFDSSWNPAISYYAWFTGTGPYALKYAHWNGSDWDTEKVDQDGVVGYASSLEFDADGYAVISYGDYTAGNNGLKLARWSPGGWNIQTIVNVDEMGYCTSLALDGSGNPAIAFFDRSSHLFKYVCWDSAEGEWILEIVGDGGTEYADYVSLAFDSSGVATIAYYNKTTKDLMFAVRQ